MVRLIGGASTCAPKCTTSNYGGKREEIYFACTRPGNDCRAHCWCIHCYCCNDDYSRSDDRQARLHVKWGYRKGRPGPGDHGLPHILTDPSGGGGFWCRRQL